MTAPAHHAVEPANHAVALKNHTVQRAHGAVVPFCRAVRVKLHAGLQGQQPPASATLEIAGPRSRAARARIKHYLVLHARWHLLTQLRVQRVMASAAPATSPRALFTYSSPNSSR